MPPSASKTLEAAPVLERIKKYLSNKQAWNEFLRILESYTSNVIDKSALVTRVDDGFIGNNAELSSAFKKILEYDGRDTVIENQPAPSENKVVLSNCRALGPSYRLLPKRERYAKCSGRDEMCYEVLNDNWASHPTWASEDSGFVSHKKNQYEEALYRMEEERHDYDFNIETITRTIQLLEPLVQQMNMLDPEEKKNYKLPPGLGGQSEAIWQRVIKKLYDRPNGTRMIEDMFARPFKACPVVLLRLKEKAEKWRQAQREWEKVWREQTHKQFWKSLDHQSINAKTENKKYFQPKQLQTDINAKYEEQRRQRQLKPAGLIPRHQFEFYFTDPEVIYDVCHLLLTYLRTNFAHADAHKIENFIKNFIPTFFGLDKEIFLSRMTDVYSDTPPNEEDEDSTANDDTPQRSRRGPNGKQNLLRGVLDPGKSGKKDSRVNSKESTPDGMSVDEEPSTPTDSQSDQPSRMEPSENRWIEHPRERSSNKLNEPFDRTSFSLYANLNIYCFMRLFAMFYERLTKIKAHEPNVQEDVRRALMVKAALDLRISDRSPVDFFEDVSPGANYYRQIIKMCESYMEQHTDMTKIEETLRRFYIPCGYQLYSFDKWLGNILKFAGSAVVNDAKDRNNDIVNLFLNNRKESQTTHQIEIEYRKQVEKLAKDSDIYRIVYVSLFNLT
jgi:paired amphipathic helix protein Sin3a